MVGTFGSCKRLLSYKAWWAWTFIILDRYVRAATAVKRLQLWSLYFAALACWKLFQYYLVDTTHFLSFFFTPPFPHFQQGTLGRYPVHFHMSSDVSGSVVAKNTIRQSNQRCIVIHGTDNVLVQENVGYSNAAHCYLVEDGIERGNRFIRNLGAETSVPAKNVPGGSDQNEPSIYWITNPTNIFVGNIAAGSEGSGFWFELGVRGEREHLYLGVDPKREPLLLFKDNTAHSCLNVSPITVSVDSSLVFCCLDRSFIDFVPIKLLHREV